MKAPEVLHYRRSLSRSLYAFFGAWRARARKFMFIRLLIIEMPRYYFYSTVVPIFVFLWLSNNTHRYCRLSRALLEDIRQCYAESSRYCWYITPLTQVHADNIPAKTLL